jgi:hypothetical protein
LLSLAFDPENGGDTFLLNLGQFSTNYMALYGARGSLLVKVLGYKPEGCGFKTRWGEILNLPNPSGHTRLWGLLNL